MYLEANFKMTVARFISQRLRSTDGDSFTRIILYFAVGTIALCVAVILLAHALILGFKTEIKAKVFGFWGHIQITGLNLNNTFESPPIQDKQTFYPALDTVGRISLELDPDAGSGTRQTTFGGIRHIQSYALKPGILTGREDLDGIILKGVGADFDWEFLSRYMVDGEPLLVTDTVPSRDILISQTTASRLRLGINDPLIVYFIQENRQIERRFRVRGIYKTGLEEYDRKLALVDIRQIREVNGWPEHAVTGFEVLLDDLRDLDAFTNYIYYEWLPDDLYIEPISQKFPAIFDWVDLQNINERVLIILMLIVAMINLITVLLILILERLTMVGILKALGASDGMIRSIFIRLTLRILVWGMAIGNVVALSVGMIQSRFQIMKLDEAEYYLSVVPIRWDPWFILFVNVLLVIVAIFTLWIPSMYIKRIQPVKSIQFK